MSEPCKAVRSRVKESDIPFALGVFVMERIGRGDQDPEMQKVKIMRIDGEKVLTSTMRWYDRWTGAQIKDGLPGPYRSIHSLGYSGATY